MGIASIPLRPSVCARLEPWAGARVRSRPWGRCVECGPESFDPRANSGPRAHARFDVLSRVGDPLPLSRSGHGLFGRCGKQNSCRSLARHFEIPPAGRAVTGVAARVTTPLRSLVTRAAYRRSRTSARMPWHRPWQRLVAWCALRHLTAGGGPIVTRPVLITV